MKNLFFLFFVLSFATNVCGQKIAVQIEKASDYNISQESLDKIYIDALNSNSTLELFKDQEEQKKFMNSYKAMLKDVVIYLAKNNFKWGKPTRCFNKIYFSKNGSIDCFLYHFYPNEISKEKEADFDVLMNKFVKQYTIAIKAAKNFSTQGPVEYNDLSSSK